MNQNITELPVSSYRRLVVTVTDAENALIALDGEIRWVMSSMQTSAAVVTKNIGDGVTVLDQLDEATKGQFAVEILPGDTALLRPGMYYHEARYTDIEGHPVVILHGHVALKASPSR